MVNLLIIFILLFIGCNHQIEHCFAKTSFEEVKYEPLIKALDLKDFDLAFSLAKNFSHKEMKGLFEERLKQGKSLPNYGVLLDLNAIDTKNSQLFLPKENNQPFLGLANRGDTCWFISSIMMMSRMKGLDEILKLDLNTDLQNKRHKKSQEFSSNIIKTMRHLIYEIRLGEKASKENLAYFLNRHEKAYEQMDEEVLAGLYYDIFNLYDFRGYYSVDGDLNFNAYLSKPTAPSWDKVLDAVLKQRRIILSHDPISTVAYHLKARSGGQSYQYLASFLAITDPFGIYARYANFFELNSKDSINLLDPLSASPDIGFKKSISVFSKGTLVPVQDKKMVFIKFMASEIDNSLASYQAEYRANFITLKPAKPSYAYRICASTCSYIALEEFLHPSFGVPIATIKDGTSKRGIYHSISELRLANNNWHRHDNNYPFVSSNDINNFIEDISGSFNSTMTVYE